MTFSSDSMCCACGGGTGGSDNSCGVRTAILVRVEFADATEISGLGTGTNCDEDCARRSLWPESTDRCDALNPDQSCEFMAADTQFRVGSYGQTYFDEAVSPPCC